MTNRLAHETSPYLLQHAENPVDWYPWGAEAFVEALRTDRPIFLSVGYSTCHWCHVMARESFEDDETASLLNTHFVNIKVDREERPDVDAVYAAAVRAVSDHGGWPISAFLTPQGKPFYVGSYWPKTRREGRSSFTDVVAAVSDAWTERRGAIGASVEAIASRLAAAQTSTPDELDLSTLDASAKAVLSREWDHRNGGFGTAPKFPHPMVLDWLLHRHARTGETEPLVAVMSALDAMARGGIRDQLDGGFARYCVDEGWLVPHFEKMLYDNALLLPVYASAAALSGRDDLRRVARGIARYLLDEFRNAQGGFLSASDAESAGVEGGYFVWTYDELVHASRDGGAPAQQWADFLGATPSGNWDGTNVLHEPVPRRDFAARLGLPPETFDLQWEQTRQRLLEQRARRTHPDVDDKVLTDWNALTIRGLVRAGNTLGEPTWTTAAAHAAEFLHTNLFNDGRLQHVWRDGQSKVDGFLLDYACLALADLEIFQAGGDELWFDRALSLTAQAQKLFFGTGDASWFQSTGEDRILHNRPEGDADDQVPSGSSVMVEVYLTLAGLTGDPTWRQLARDGVRVVQKRLRANPLRHGWMLRQAESLAAEPAEIAIVGAPGEGRDSLAREVLSRPRPGTTLVIADADSNSTVPLLVDRTGIDGRATAYVCHDLACQLPVTSPEALADLLNAASAAGNGARESRSAN